MDNKITYNIINDFQISEFIGIIFYLFQFAFKVEELISGKYTYKYSNYIFFFNKPSNFILTEHLCCHIIFL